MFKNQLHLADEKITTHPLEAHSGFLIDLSRFIGCPLSLPLSVKNRLTYSLLMNLI